MSSINKITHNDQYRLLLEATHEIIYELDANGYFTYVHPNTIEKTGYALKDLLGKDFGKLMAPEHRESTKTLILQNQESESKITHHEIVLVTQSGRKVLTQQHFQVKKQGKDISGFYVVGKEIPHLVRTHTALNNEVDKVTSPSSKDLPLKKTLLHELKIQKVLIEIASSHINISLNQIENSINASLKKLGRFVSADRVYVFDYDLKKMTASNTYEWCEEGISPEINNLQDVPIEYIPQWIEAHKKNEPFYIPDVLALEDDGEGGLRSILEPQGIKSLIAIPMLYEQKLMGFVGFDSVQKHYSYSTEEQQLLKLFAEMLINLEHRQKSQQRLKLQEEKSRNIISNINLSLLEIDLTETIVYANNNFCQMLNLQFDDIRGKKINDLLVNNKIKRKISCRSLKKNQKINYELELTEANGITRHYYVNSSPNYNDEGELIGNLRTYLDITSRKNIEQELNETKQKLNKYKIGLEAINALTANPQLSYSEQIEAGLLIVLDYLELDTAIVSEVKEDNYKITYAHTTRDDLALKIGDTFKLSNTLCYKSILDEKVFSIDNISKSKFKNHSSHTEAGFECYLGIPYKVNKTLRGTIVFTSAKAKTQPFNPYEIEFMNLFGRWLGFTITNAENQATLHLRQNTLSRKNLELKKYSNYLNSLNSFVTGLLKKETTEEICWEITEKLINQFDFEDCVVYLVNENTNELDQIAAYGPKQGKGRSIRGRIAIPLGEGIVGHVGLTGQPEIINNTMSDPRYLQDDEARLSELTVPIIAGEKVIGVIDSENRKKEFFTKTQLDRLTTIANLASNRLKSAIDRESELLAKKELAENKTKLWKILDNALDAVITIDNNGTITEWNKKSEEIFGFTATECIGMQITKTILPTKSNLAPYFDLKAFLNTSFDTNINQKTEGIARRKNGEHFPVETAIIPIESKGKLTFTIFLTDITTRKEAKTRMEKALHKEKELNELKSKFIAMTSHEFRTPLTIIKQNTDILEYQLKKDLPEWIEKYNKYFDRMDIDLNRLTSLLDDILLRGKIDSRQISISKKSTDLETFIKKTIIQLEEIDEKHRKIEFKVKGTPQKVNIDNVLMHHVVTNLLSNALKYSLNDKSPRVDLTFRSDNKITISFKDNGIGIPINDQKKLFTPFFRASNVGNIKGTGLGLSIVKEFIEMHGGHIHFESTEGQGSAFTINLNKT